MKFDLDLCLNLQYDFGQINSTLGSVVPLAMFKRYVGPDEHVLVDAVVFHWLESLSFGEEKERKKWSCGNYFLEKKEKVCYTADDTMVLVMALMETDGKGNSHVCYPVITLNRHENTIYI